jgi:predicted membrane protein (TIGR00267 family)
VADIFKDYGLTEEEIMPILNAFQANPDIWVDFMMKHELGLEKSEPKQAVKSAVTVALSYAIGGFIPLFPYMVISQTRIALLVSAAITLLALFIFGYIKGRFVGKRPIKSAFSTMVIGGLAAGAAYFLATLISTNHFG